MHPALPLVSVALALFGHLAASGQQTVAPKFVGNLSGVVTEESGGVVPGVRIVVLRDSDQRIAITDRDGRYRFERLPAGMYMITASLAGFVTERGQLQIASDQDVAWNATIRVRSGFRPETGYSELAPKAADSVDPQVSAGVYEAVLAHLFRGKIPERLTIRSISLIQPFDEFEWPRQLAAVPIALQRSSSTVEARRPVRLRAEAFPPAAHLIDSPGPDDLPFTAFSPVFLSDNGLGALVVYNHICGVVCGEGTVAWLQRESVSAAWAIRATHTFVVY